MLHGAEWLGKKYASLASAGGARAQGLANTLDTLAARLVRRPDAELPDVQDRKAAVLALKGLARDHPQEVGTRALPALLETLQRDTLQERGVEDEIARAVLEALLAIVDAPNAEPSRPASLPPHVLSHIDAILARPAPLHALLPLLSPARSFYTRFAALQLLATLTRWRAPSVQEHLLTAPGGCGAVLQCLAEGSGSSSEIVRNEALLLLPRLVDSNADIQKLVAFEGAFEKLIDVVAAEGRIEGGLLVQDALEGLESLLRWNVSNQNYFRETLSVPLLAPLLYFPAPPPAAGFSSRAAEQEHARQLEAFAFQSWDDEEVVMPDAADGAEPLKAPRADDGQKARNAALVLGIARLLVEGQGEGRRANQNALLAAGFTRCLLELALASTAPLGLKAQALSVLTSLLHSSRANQDLLSSLLICPLLAVDSPAAEEGAPPAPSVSYTRLPARSAVLVLIDAAVSGAPPAVMRQSSAPAALAFRTAALGAFDAFVADNLDARHSIIAGMVPESEDQAPSAGVLLLNNLAQFPSAPPSGRFDAYRSLFSALLFSSLVRGSETAKGLAREIRFGAEGKVVGRNAQPDADDDEVSLLHVLVGNLMLSERERGEAIRRERNATAGAGAPQADLGGLPSSTDWTRIAVGYLSLLAQWLWDSPASVADLLSESSNVQTLVQPAAQSGGGVDALVASLCALVLGVAYEFAPHDNAECVTRATMHPLLVSRIGTDQFAARLARLRDDVRIKETSPDTFETVAAALAGEVGEEGIWFDWPFVEWLKNNFVRVQKSITIDPASSSETLAAAPAELLDAQRQAEQLRDTAARQARELEALEARLAELSRVAEEERTALTTQLAALTSERDANAANSASNATPQADLEAALADAQRAKADAQQDAAAAREAEEQARQAAAAAEAALGAATSRTAEVEARAAEAQRLVTAAESRAADAEARAAAAQAEAAARPAPEAAAAAAKAEPEADDGARSRSELEKELEDLLVLLDDLTQKRVADKAKMRAANLEVSDDEADDDDDDDDDVE